MIKQVENLQVEKIAQFKKGEQVGEKAAISFIIDGFYFGFYAEEVQHLAFFPNDRECAVKYRAVCFSISLDDAGAIQEKIKELAN